MKVEVSQSIHGSGADPRRKRFVPARFQNGKWRGELTTRQHQEAVGVILLFGGREVTCGFTGTYSDAEAEVNGTALVGKTSVSFHARLTLQSPL